MSRVLDLYAGSGALGIEAISRGAQWCDFVEQDRAACDAIRENLRLTGFESQAHVYHLQAGRALAKLTGPYTLVLADPPYEDNTALPLLESLTASCLAEEGRTVLVLEHSARHDPPTNLGRLALVNSRRHGDSAISIYR
jgi:16S rRNA (guanine966-N2)-methyltransferase